MAEFNDIYDLRGALERGLAAGIAASMALIVSEYTRQNAVMFQKDTPRCEIAATIGNATGARTAFPNATPPVTKLNHWSFSVQFHVLSEAVAALMRGDGESDADFQTRVNANAAIHPQIISAIRNYLSTAAQQSWADAINFPNHYICEALRDSGSPSTFTGNDGFEETKLAYSGVVAIRDSAWPTT